MPGRFPRLPRPFQSKVEQALPPTYVHDHQVVRRDIKPANIMIVRDGLMKITDFGIARMRQSEEEHNRLRAGLPQVHVAGTDTGKRADHRSDIFSLGIVTYEMLTGSVPFNGDSIHSIMTRP